MVLKFKYLGTGLGQTPMPARAAGSKRAHCQHAVRGKAYPRRPGNGPESAINPCAKVTRSRKLDMAVRVRDSSRANSVARRDVRAGHGATGDRIPPAFAWCYCRAAATVRRLTILGPGR